MVVMTRRPVYLGSLVLLCIALVGGISAVGLLQSTETVGTSGIFVQPPPPPPPPPPEPTVEIDVYSDLACTLLLSTVNWGSIEAGGSVQETVYIKNAGDQNVTLTLATANWLPTAVEADMVLTWDYVPLTIIAPGDVATITLTLAVDSGITGTNSFSFDIVITASQS